MTKKQIQISSNKGEHIHTASQKMASRRIVRHPLADLNIRIKIIAPFLILTLIAATGGIFVAIDLMVNSLDERLNEYARNAGQVVSNILVQQEVKHQNVARAVAYTEGFNQALYENDTATATALASPTIKNDQTDLFLSISATGQTLVHLRYEDKQLQVAEEPLDLNFAGIISQTLANRPTSYVEHRALARYPVTQEYYYLSIITIHSKAEGFVGVTVVGTKLDSLMQQFKRNALADITLYIDGGEAIASNFEQIILVSPESNVLETLRLEKDTYDAREKDPRRTELRTVSFGQQEYRLAIGALYVGKDLLGVFSVALPTDIVVDTGAANRNGYIIIFVSITFGIITLGYGIARSIIEPVRQLTTTSQAVTHGDLDRRAQLTSNDEIGQLGRDFDTMTEELTKALGEKQAILTSIGDGVALVDRENHITPANQAAEKILNEMRQTDPGLQALRRLIGEQTQIEESLEDLWQQEQRRLNVGKKIIAINSATVRNNLGKLLGTVIVLRDVTVEVETQRTKDAFVEHVSHELRTPLTPIKGYSALLLATAKDTLNAQQLAFLQTIADKAEVLNTMVNTLLDFSEMQASGRLGLRTQDVKLPDMIDELTQEWQEKIEEKGLGFHVTCTDDLPDTIKVDGKRLKWAITSLLKNACDYSDTGHINLKVYISKQQRLNIAVEDTGIGIAPENHEHIFAGFSRVMNVEDDKVRGMGLGLYVSKAIIEAHSGTITVNSALGKGSTFTIDLPISASEATP